MLKLNDNNISHLNFLTKLGDNVLVDFCKLSWDYISKGPNSKLYNSAAQKLEVEPQIIQHVVEALSNLLVECCKHKISQPRLKENLGTLGFNEEQSKVVCNFYKAKQSDINHILLAGAVQLPTFKELEWRIEAQIGRRSLGEEIVAGVTMRLSVERGEEEGWGGGGGGGGVEERLLKTDPGNLGHVTRALEDALASSASHHARRVRRRFSSTTTTTSTTPTTLPA